MASTPKVSPATCRPNPLTVMDDKKVCKNHKFPSLEPKTLQLMSFHIDLSNNKHRLLVHLRNAHHRCLLVTTIRIQMESGRIQQKIEISSGDVRTT
jgi:hypothetical protein